MIGSLRGILLHKQPPELVVEVNGVGYELQAPMSTFFELPAVGEETRLYTHLIVREDAHVLFAFVSTSDRALFRELLKVNGVGARLALTILSGMSAEEFSRCIADDDSASLVRLPGIGKKTAERLIIEMRDRLKKLVGLTGGVTAGSVSAAAGQGGNSAISEAENALVALGYKPNDVSRLVRSVETEGRRVEDIVRDVLKGMAK